MRADRAALEALFRRGAALASFSVRTAGEAVRHNGVRALLTSLGILFGVASVIAMLAIGRGAEREILEQMKLLGTNNIRITPLVEQQEGPAADQTIGPKPPKRWSPGLTWADAAALAQIPSVDVASAEIVVNSAITREGHRRSGKVVGVDTSYFRLGNMELAAGTWFNAAQVQGGMPVAIIGQGVRARFFTTEEPLGRAIKVGDNWLTVIGVLADRRVSGETAQRLGIRDVSMDVYVPTRTMLLRFRNRAELSQRDIQAAARAGANGATSGSDAESDEQREERLNRNQLDAIIVRVADSRLVPGVADVARRMLTRRHNAVVDFEITVPELLLRQEQRTKTIFNVVLGAIASISLLVGGIGIMNIMLASVMERIREIGVRRAVGATRRHVLSQFLTEAVLISAAGGIAGIVVGWGFSAGIQRFAGITTIVSAASVVLSFGVSVSVGLAFGIVPAYRAAQQDPVECLRYE